MQRRFAFHWWGILDAGMVINSEQGLRLYAPGELMQGHGFIGSYEVWAECHRPTRQYRLAVGLNPCEVEPISEESFMKQIRWMRFQDERVAT